MKVETIKIEHGDGFCLINASDFDPKKHVKYGMKKQAVSRETPKDAVSHVPFTYDIDGMGKTDVVEMLKAHGVKNPSGTVGTLRKKLRKIMFIEAD